jgi:hypothetical protein
MQLDGHCQERAASMLSALADADLDERRRTMAAFVDGFIARLYPAEAAEVLAGLDAVLAACRQDYLNHATLMRAWPRLVETAVREGTLLRAMLADGSAA